ncbi:flagella synthesis protein FlgN [Motiliproteus sediminis]|uniref:flagella synthesis protein FlgN n=1 Tax=Motiliproteus sediminis TaxID=1468178 RepID=UPI001AEF73DE|nr:flagellar protein FlgN [Motiliproteus sediminis]
MTQTPSAFMALVSEGSELLATLCRLSDAEKSAIEKMAAADLQHVVTAKQQSLQALAANTDARNQFLRQQGLSCDQQGVDQLIASLPTTQGQQLQNAWNKLTETLRRAAELNQRNEQIVKRNQQSLEQLLSILRGQSGKTTLYDQAGLKNYSARGTLGKA